MHFQRLLLLFVASNSGKKYWDWTLPRIRAQIELSSTFVYDYKMSTSGSSAKNSHLTQGGRTTIMPMPVNRVTSQWKMKLSQNYCPWINLHLWNFCHSFLQWIGSSFVSVLFFFFFFFPIYLLIITLNNYSYNTTEKKTKQKQNKNKNKNKTKHFNNRH